MDVQAIPFDAIPIREMVRQSQFPDCALGKVVQIQNVIGRVTELVDDRKRFHLMDFQSGKTRVYDVAIVVESFRS
jgi:hypothetical protein